MRTKFALLVVLLAIGIAATVTVTGQEETPLPQVQTRGITLEPASIVLAVEPIRTIQQPTLADAVRRNDYVSFHALYEESRPAEYKALDDLWTWSMSDPLGAFYGRDTYERLSRAYPGYAKYIEQYRIVDQRGNVFYPTSETRTFLLNRALEREAPRVQVAESPRRTQTTSQSPRRTRSAAVSAAVPAASRRRPASAPVAVATNGGVDAAVPAGGDAGAPQVTPAPVVVQPQPVAQAQPAATTPTTTTTTTPARTPNSGILLLVIGLIGVGLLAVILRTPRESTPTSIIQPTPQAPPAEAKPNAGPTPVEPIRRETPRATGSHG